MAVAVENLITTDVLRPARYLGNELGAVHKPWESAVVRWVLTYPEVYEVGASNLGHIILYSILNAQPRQLCDRSYLPAVDLVNKLREQSVPLFAVESKRPLTDFDILGFSLSYELGATNILEMLALAGIPLTWRERKAPGVWQIEQGSFPLIFAGGQTATSNPEPYADFLDFVALGDGEELLPEIGMILEEGKAAGLSRDAILFDLAQIPGVYVPQFYDMAEDGAIYPNRPGVPDRVLRRVTMPIPAYSIGLVPYVETVHDRLTIEIRRGCTRGCRFCQPGMLTRPARDVEPDQVIEAVEQGMRATGYNEFSLLSLSCSDYLALPAIGLEIKNRLKQENVSLSLPSQRVDRFDENIANILGGTRQSSITFAPEAGTQRMRDIINKGLTNEELLRGVKTAYEQGWDRVKLYFMIGLPGETDVDVIGIAETIRWLQQECRVKGRKPMGFNVTISNFTPKPHTPFQWHSVATAEFGRKQTLLRQEFRTIRGLKANFTDVRISAMEDFVGRGDRRLGSVVRRAWELGAGMDSWWESLERAYGAWTLAIEEAGLIWKYRKLEQGEWNIFSPPAEVQCPKSDEARAIDDSTTPASIDLDAPLPWDYIDTGIEKTWLKSELLRALEAATVPDCSFDGCSHCGVCGPDFGHNIIVPPLPIPTFAGQTPPSSERAQRVRIWFGKHGDIALLSHLDLMRLLDRAVRRAALPISFTAGFHPGPRISPAMALPLGTTSSGEIADFDLAQVMDITDFCQQLVAQLPSNLPIFKAESIAIEAPSASYSLDRANYRLVVSIEEDEPSEPLWVADWQRWIDTVLAQSEIWLEHTTKSGKLQSINVRDRLFALTLAPEESLSNIPMPFSGIAAVTPVVVQFQGVCRNDGTLLRPEHVIKMLEGSAQRSIRLLHAHRDSLVLS